MIGKLKGVVEEIFNDAILLDVRGVSYKITTPHSYGLNPGEARAFYIETVLRQDSLHLYGFLTYEEQSWFNLLTSVQGVGSRMALSLQSLLPPQDLLNAIAAQDKSTLTRADGVGPKLATRIVTELKDKVAKGMSLTSTSSTGPTTSQTEDAIFALLQLGYKRQEVSSVVAQYSKDHNTVEGLLKASLAHLAKAS